MGVYEAGEEESFAFLLDCFGCIPAFWDGIFGGIADNKGNFARLVDSDYAVCTAVQDGEGCAVDERANVECFFW